MSAQRKADAWILGYEWASGETYIGENCTDINITSLQIMPEFEEGVQVALAEAKEKLMLELLTGELQ